MTLAQAKKVHLVGASGVSMKGIAKVLVSRGVKVTGCDVSNGGHDQSHIGQDIDLVIYSSAITPSSSGYKELEKAKQLGIGVEKRAWVLGQLMLDKTGLAIAGMHGKSTTTAMVGAILEQAGHDPLVLGAETRLGNGKYVVTEADEYDRSFHYLNPKGAIILNIDSEHLDYYDKGLPEIIRAFREFAKLVAPNGVIVANQDDKNVMAVVKSAKAKIKTVSQGKPWSGLNLKIWGKHNLFNATAAAHLCHEFGVSSRIIQKALNNFMGIKRRMEFKGQANGVMVYDDYAHHPTEIKASLRAAREHFGTDKRIVVVFQPHQFSRTKLLFSDFIKSFADASELIIAPIFGVVGRDEKQNVSSAELAFAIKNLNARAMEQEEIINWLNANAKPGDVIITMGAGPINIVGEQWLKFQG